MNLYRTIPLAALALLLPAAAGASDDFDAMLRSHRDTIIDILRADSGTLVDITADGLEQRSIDAYEKQWEKDLLTPKNVKTSGRPSVGPYDAPVTIVFYAKHESGYCRMAEETLETVLKEYPGKVRLVMKIIPARSDAARTAAKWLVAAGRTAPAQAWEFHRSILQEELLPGTARLRALAAKSGISVKGIEAYISANERDIVETIGEDRIELRRLGLHGVPVFLVNDLVLRGPAGPEAFRRAIGKALSEKNSTGRSS